MKKSILSTTAVAVLAFCSPALATSGYYDAETNTVEAQDEGIGEFFGQLRYRYEYVEQENLNREAKGHIARANLGFVTNEFENFRGLVELQVVHNFGAEEFNDTINGNATLPIIADPDNEEVNQLWLSWDGLPQTSVKVGRQKINLDNQRFIGTVDFRMNDQTFDAVNVTNTSIDGLELSYGYIDNVNRIFGDDAPLGDLDSNIHIAHASYEFSDWLTATTYGYWFDFDELANRSSKTYGLRFTGNTQLTENWRLFYEAEYAEQDDYANNPANFSEDYLHISPWIKGHGFDIRAGYERLGGDGTNAFQTPLATGHKFNGWADVFVNIPVQGLEDRYVSVAYDFFPEGDSFLNNTKLWAIYRDFEGDDSGDFGSEIDLLASKRFRLPQNDAFDWLTVTLKYADYDAEDAPLVDTEKYWVELGLKF